MKRGQVQWTVDNYKITIRFMPTWRLLFQLVFRKHVVQFSAYIDNKFEGQQLEVRPDKQNFPDTSL